MVYYTLAILATENAFQSSKESIVDRFEKSIIDHFEGRNWFGYEPEIGFGLTANWDPVWARSRTIESRLLGT